MTAAVSRAGGGRFVWTFDAPYDDAGAGTWTPADFGALQVAGLTPAQIDEVIGVDGTLTLVYPVQDRDAPAMFDVSAAPAVLSFAGGRALAVPQNGNVTP